VVIHVQIPLIVKKDFYAWKLAKASKNAKRQSASHHLIAPFNNTAIPHIHVLMDVKVTQIAILENSATKTPIPVNLMAVVLHNWTVKSENFAMFQQELVYKILSIGVLCVALMISISANQQMVCVYIQMMVMVAPLIYLQIRPDVLLMKSASLMISMRSLLRVVSTTRLLWQVPA